MRGTVLGFAVKFVVATTAGERPLDNLMSAEDFS